MLACLVCSTLPLHAQDAPAEGETPAEEPALPELPPIVDPNPAQAVEYAEVEVARRTAQLAELQQQVDVINLEIQQAQVELAQAQGALSLVTTQAEQATASVAAGQTALAQAAELMQAQEAAHHQMVTAATAAQQMLAAAQQSMTTLAPQLEQSQQQRTDAVAAKVIVDAALEAATQRMAIQELTPEQQAEAAAALQQAQTAQGLTNRLATERTAAHDALSQQMAAATDAVAQAQAAYDQALVAQTQAEADLASARAAHATAQANLVESQTLLTQSQAAVAIVQARIEQLTPQMVAKQEQLAPVQATLTAMQAALDVSTKRRDVFLAAPPVPDPTQIREVAVFQHDRPLMCVDFDPTGEYLFAGSQDNSIQRWRVWDQQKTALTGHASWPSQLVVASTGTLYSTGHEGTLLSWSGMAAPPALLSTIPAHEGFARALAISPDGQFVVTVGNDHKAKVWSTVDNSLVAELIGHESHIYNLAFHPSGEFLVTGDLNGVLKQWQTATWEFTRDLNADVLYKYDAGFLADVGGVRGISFSTDGTRLAVGGMGNVSNAFAGIGTPTGALFDCDTGMRLQVMTPAENFEGAIWALEFDPHGQYIVAAGGGNSGMMWFWRPGEEKSFHQFALPGIAYDLAVHPDGQRIAVALYDNTVRVYELLADPLAPPPTEESAAATE